MTDSEGRCARCGHRATITVFGVVYKSHNFYRCRYRPRGKNRCDCPAFVPASVPRKEGSE